jgi:hypothetical protein
MFAQQSYCLPNFSGIVGLVNDDLQWDRLGPYVIAARGPRSQKAIQRLGGPSDTIIGKIENNHWRPKRAVDDTLAKLDKGLDWEQGSALRILRGGEPEARTPAQPAASVGPPVIEYERSPAPTFAAHSASGTAQKIWGVVRAVAEEAAPLEDQPALRAAAAQATNTTSILLTGLVLSSPDAATAADFLTDMILTSRELTNALTKEPSDAVSGDQTTQSDASSKAAEVKEVKSSTDPKPGWSVDDDITSFPDGSEDEQHGTGL